MKDAKKAIKLAFIKILNEKDIDKITIKEIALEANINRKTFYNHYPNIYELLNEIENDITNDFYNLIIDIDLNVMANDSSVLFTKITDFINKDIEFYTHLMRYNSISNLPLKLSITFKSIIKEYLNDNYDLNTLQLDIISDYIIGGILEVYRTWFLNQDQDTLEAVCNTANILIFQGLREFIKSNNS